MSERNSNIPETSGSSQHSTDEQGTAHQEGSVDVQLSVAEREQGRVLDVMIAENQQRMPQNQIIIAEGAAHRRNQQREVGIQWLRRLEELIHEIEEHQLNSTERFTVHDSDSDEQLAHLFSQQLDFDIIPQIQLSDEAFAQIPSTQITNEQVNDEAKCTICLTSFTLDETVWQLPCQHCYHSDCIVPWVKYYNSCPTCRAVVC